MNNPDVLAVLREAKEMLELVREFFLRPDSGQILASGITSSIGEPKLINRLDACIRTLEAKERDEHADNPRVFCPDCGADLGNFYSNRLDLRRDGSRPERGERGLAEMILGHNFTAHGCKACEAIQAAARALVAKSEGAKEPHEH